MGEQEAPEDKPQVLEGNDATEEELARAATKIGSVYRGKKAREEVAAKRAALEGDEPKEEEAPEEKE